MDRKRAKELLPIIQAFAEGKDVEFQQIGMTGWMNEGNDVSFEISGKYRIKPEPREWWLDPTDSDFEVWVDQETPPVNTAIKVREVLDDD